jgi:membrane-bound ClpP family serine protease
MNSKSGAQASTLLLALGLVYVMAGLGLGGNSLLLGSGVVFFLFGLARLVRGR